MFKVNNRDTRTRCEICSKLTIKIPERRHPAFSRIQTKYGEILRYHLRLFTHGITTHNTIYSIQCRNQKLFYSKKALDWLSIEFPKHWLCIYFDWMYTVWNSIAKMIITSKIMKSCHEITKKRWVDEGDLMKKKYIINLMSDSHLPKKLCYLLHWKPFKIDEKCFLFHVKSSFGSWDIYIFVLTSFVM